LTGSPIGGSTVMTVLPGQGGRHANVTAFQQQLVREAKK
jgi:hypothetical protein